MVARAGGVVRTDPRLRELDLGRWQGLTSEQARAQFPDEHAAWRAGADVPRGGGETYAQAGARAAACITEALADVPAGGTLLAVTHGGTARGAVAALLELGEASAWRVAALGNTCWSVLVEAERGWRLERHGVGAEQAVLVGEGAADRRPARTSSL
ncbi:MAG: Phosphoglycerate mutase [Frankiales bacterium]|nr:Phosphoglycerate mutase [Frankiales bacterium]